MNDPSDRTTIVVGASPGLDLGIATACAEAGAPVIAVARTAPDSVEIDTTAGPSGADDANGRQDLRQMSSDEGRIARRSCIDRPCARVTVIDTAAVLTSPIAESVQLPPWMPSGRLLVLAAR